jgi:uncharacterized membrane protein
MITMAYIYILVGAFFAIVSLLSLLDSANPRRVMNFLFWGLLAGSFLAGQYLGNLGNGILALGLVIIATIGLGQGKPVTTTPEQRRRASASAARRGDLLFLPALVIPAVALFGGIVLRRTRRLPGQPDHLPAQAGDAHFARHRRGAGDCCSRSRSGSAPRCMRR